MDLRPKIAREAAIAIVKDLWENGTPAPESWIERFSSIIVSKIVHHSIDFGALNSYSTIEPEVVEAFLAKYPELRQILADCQAKAREIWPDAEQILEVTNDPEGCHTCREGQSLHLEVLRHQPFLEDDKKGDEWDEWWFAYRHGKDAEKTYNEIFDLFMVMPGYASEEDL